MSAPAAENPRDQQQAQRIIASGLCDSQTVMAALGARRDPREDLCGFLARHGRLPADRLATLRGPPDSGSGRQPTAPAPGSARHVDERAELTARLARIFAEDPLFTPHAAYAFETGESLGEGGMATVRAVRDQRLDRRLAIKLLDDSDDALRRARFLREAHITALLDHPAIPPIHELGSTAEGRPYILMRLVDGHTLGEAIREARSQGPSHRRRELLGILAKVSDAVAYAHSRGVVHRDLKPSNIMVGRFGEVYVMDWGIACRLDRDDASPEVIASAALELPAAELAERGLTISGSVVGTPGYMPPEQARGDRIDGRADVFALGAILTEILVGEPAVTGETSLIRIVATLEERITAPRDVDRSVPRDLDGLALAALEPDPEDRLGSAEQFAADLQAWLAGEPLECHRYGPVERLQLEVRRRPAVFLLLAGLALAGLLGVGVLLEQRHLRGQAAEARAATARMEGLVRGFERARALAERRRPEDAEVVEETLEDALTLGGRNGVNLVAAGRIARRAGNLKLASRFLEEAVRTDPPGLEALFELHLVEQAGDGTQRLDWTEALSRLVKAAETSGVVNEFTLSARASQALNSKRYDEAAALADQALELNSSLITARNVRGLCLFNQGKLEEARRSFREMVRERPDSVAARANLSRVLETAGRTAEARRELGQAIALAPERAVLRFNRANVHRKLGDINAAVEDLEVAVRLAPGWQAARRQLGTMLILLGRNTEAIERFKEVLASAPEDHSSHSNLSLALANVQRGQEALEAGRRAVELAPDNPGYRTNLASFHDDFSAPEVALRHWREATERFPEHAMGWRGLGHRLRLAGRFEEARRCLETARRLDPSDPDVLDALGEVLVQLGLHDEAFQRMSEAARAAPNAPRFQLNFGNLCLRLGRTAEAITALDAAVRLDPNNPIALTTRGEARRRINDLNGALLDFNAALKANPKSVNALVNRSAILLTQPNGQEAARADLVAAVTLDPKNAVAHYNLGYLAFLRNRAAPAIEHLGVAIGLQPTYLDAHLLRAEIYKRCGRPAEALRDLNTACSFRPLRPEPVANRAGLLRELGRLAEAARDYKVFLKHFPDHAKAPIIRQLLQELGG